MEMQHYWFSYLKICLAEQFEAKQTFYTRIEQKNLFLCFPGSSNYTEKRRKPTQLSSMVYLLEDTDIQDDLKIINKNKAFSVSC